MGKNDKDLIMPDVLNTLSEKDLNTAFVCHSKLFQKGVGGILVVTNTKGLKK